VLCLSLLATVMSPPPVAAEQQDESPSPALLDYLGGWELNNGQRIDPLDLETMKVPKQEKEDREDDDQKDH
jgi:hypothetical protein